MSKSLQSQIKLLNSEEISSSNITFYCKKIGSITEEALQDLSFESIQSLLEISCKMIQFFKNNQIFEAYTKKQIIKKLSEEISKYYYLLNIHYPATHKAQISLDAYTYHELEKLAIAQQKEITQYLEKIPQSSGFSNKKDLFCESLQNFLTNKPKFNLLLFKYQEGISSFFNHDEFEICLKKEKVQAEVDKQQDFLYKKYGYGVVNKIIATRQKWDSEYYTVDRLIGNCNMNNLERLYCNYFTQLSESSQDLKKISHDEIDEETVVKEPKILELKSAWLNQNFSKEKHKFIEGDLQASIALELVDMTESYKKCIKKNLKYSDDEIEVIF